MVQAVVQRKRAWLAILLNVIVPGLGYLYVGEGKRLWFSLGLLITNVILYVATWKKDAGQIDGWVVVGGIVYLVTTDLPELRVCLCECENWQNSFTRYWFLWWLHEANLLKQHCLSFLK